MLLNHGAHATADLLRLISYLASMLQPHKLLVFPCEFLLILSSHYIADKI